MAEILEFGFPPAPLPNHTPFVVLAKQTGVTDSENKKLK